MRLLFVRALAASALLPAAVAAQTQTLTEEQALAQLTPDNPYVRAIDASIGIARADVDAAGRWPNPRYTYNRESVAGVTEHQNTFSQVLPITGRRSLDVSAALALVDGSTARAREQQRGLRADVRQAFAALLAAQQRERELIDARDRLQALSDVLGKREAAGDAAGFDRLRAQREVLELDVDRAAAAADRGRAQAALAGFLIGPGPASEITAVGRSASRTSIPTVDELVARAEQTRGDVMALRRDVEAATFSEKGADRRAIPEPELVGGTKSSNAGRGDIGSVFAVHLALPLFDRNEPERAMAVARRSRAEAQLAVLEVGLRTQIAGLRRLVIDRRETADRYRAEAVKSSAELERIAQVSYDAGERGILELLDAYRRGADARVRQADLDLRAREAEVELELVSGWEMP